MIRWSLTFLGIAAVIVLVGISRGSTFTWFGHDSILYGVLLLPLLLVLLVALKVFSAPGTLIGAKPFFLIVTAALLLAGALSRNGALPSRPDTADGVGVVTADR